jgi:hypothetical protein
VQEALRFFGQTGIAPSSKAAEWEEELVQEINATLKKVAEAPSFVDALYQGLLGDKQDGVYPGRAGKNSVVMSEAPRMSIPKAARATSVTG